jgi:hypothetical protein
VNGPDQSWQGTTSTFIAENHDIDVGRQEVLMDASGYAYRQNGLKHGPVQVVGHGHHDAFSAATLQGRDCEQHSVTGACN